MSNIRALDGPAKQYALTVSDSSITTITKPTENPLKERQVITLQPLNGKIWVMFGDGINTPTAQNVKDWGFEHPNKAMRSYEASATQPLYIISDSGTNNVRTAERG